MTNQLLLVGVFIATVAFALLLYAKTSSASQQLTALYGVFRNVFLLALGFVSIVFAGGPLGVIGGVVFTLLAVYFGSGHYDNYSDGNLRRRLSHIEF